MIKITMNVYGRIDTMWVNAEDIGHIRHLDDATRMSYMAKFPGKVSVTDRYFVTFKTGAVTTGLTEPGDASHYVYVIATDIHVDGRQELSV